MNKGICKVCLEQSNEIYPCCDNKECTICKDCFLTYINANLEKQAIMGARYPKCPGACNQVLSFDVMTKVLEYDDVLNIASYYSNHNSHICSFCEKNMTIVDENYELNYDSVFSFATKEVQDLFDEYYDTDPYKLMTMVNALIEEKNKMVLCPHCSSVECRNCIEDVPASYISYHKCEVITDCMIKNCPKCKVPFINDYEFCEKLTCSFCYYRFCSECLEWRDEERDHAHSKIHRKECPNCKCTIMQTEKEIECPYCSWRSCIICNEVDCFNGVCTRNVICVNCHTNNSFFKQDKGKCRFCSEIICIKCTRDGCIEESCFKYSYRCGKCSYLNRGDRNYPVHRCTKCPEVYCKTCFNKNCSGVCTKDTIECISCNKVGTFDHSFKKYDCSCGVSFCRHCLMENECTRFCNDTLFSCTNCFKLKKCPKDNEKICNECGANISNEISRDLSKNNRDDIYLKTLTKLRLTKNDCRQTNEECWYCPNNEKVYEFDNDDTRCISCITNDIKRGIINKNNFNLFLDP